MLRNLTKVLYTLLIIVESTLVLRIVFRLLNINKNLSLYKVLLDVSNFFMKPFSLLNLESFTLEGYEIDLPAITALLGYLFLGFLCLEIINAFKS